MTTRPNPTMPWTERYGYERPETPRQEVRRLRWIMRHVDKLSPAGRRWLISVLTERVVKTGMDPREG